MHRAGGGVSASTLTSLAAAVAPLPDVAFVLQAGAVGTAIGTAVAARARRRRSDTDAAQITCAWTLLGLGVGAVIAVIAALIRLAS